MAANLPAVDMQWVESRGKKAALKLEKLDTDLKNSKVKLFFVHFIKNRLLLTLFLGG